MIDISSVLAILLFLSKFLYFSHKKIEKYENAIFNYQNTRKGKLNGSIHEDLAINLYVGFYGKSLWYNNFLSQNKLNNKYDFKGFLLYLNKKDKKAKQYTKLINV